MWEKTVASTTKLYVATLVAKTKGDNLWLIDSNVTKHMAFDPQTFCHLYKMFFLKNCVFGWQIMLLSCKCCTRAYKTPHW